ncbi:MAG: hypothetical protein JW751_28190 [Polyangiaceae bacterium]|nr:hypothetical protein [Polyangiaceae bacterium]
MTALLTEILPARIRDFRPSDLDLACARGDVLWRGVEPIGPSDGRIALYLARRYSLLAPAPAPIAEPLARDVMRLLGERGALFYEGNTVLLDHGQVDSGAVSVDIAAGEMRQLGFVATGQLVFEVLDPSPGGPVRIAFDAPVGTFRL